MAPPPTAGSGWAASSRQLVRLAERLARRAGGCRRPPVRTLPIREVVPGVPVEGPVTGHAEAVHDLHRRALQDRPAGRPPGPPA